MSGESLSSRYAGIVCDLDGVVYRGADAVPHAVVALDGAREGGLRVVYATNNASRTPDEVAGHLSDLGLRLEVADVVTSSQAGAVHLADRLEPDTTVLAVGGEGVAVALREAGLSPVRWDEVDDLAEPVGAVLQGLGKDVSWRDLAAAAWAVQSGAVWVATNADLTLPEGRGLAPGNGALVAVVRAAVDAEPVVVGKPEPPLYELAARVLGVPTRQALAIGDRLDTDLAGAVRTGMDGLFVLTGVSRLRDVALAGADSRPRYVALDLRALGEAYTDPETSPDGATRAAATLGGSRATVSSEGIEVEIAGDAVAAARCLVAAAWAAVDAGADLADLPAQRWSDLEREILDAHAGGAA